MWRIIEIILFILIGFSSLYPAEKGYLMIIGGGARPDTLFRRFIELSGGPDKPLLIIPLASGDPLDAALFQRHQFESNGANNVRFILADSSTIDSDSVLQKLTEVGGVFFTGGDQNKLTHLFLGTKFLDQLHSFYNQGGIIAGTSAGAAIMCQMMITGNEKLNTDTLNGFKSIQSNNIETGPGFGFLENVIIDQHFIKRKRENRLLSLVLEHPQLLGIGIDESTAIVIDPQMIFTVIGRSNVMIIDASATTHIAANQFQHLSGQNIRLDLLIQGQRYDLKRKVLIP